MKRASTKFRKRSRASGHFGAAQAAAFTMVELVVSVGILAILMVMAGAIFTLTLRSSGEANALIEVSQIIRAFEDALREDLRNVHPGQSIMVIQGNPINAYMTLDDLEVDNDGNPATPNRRDPT
ncbi:MAG: type II secretion system protein, partial [Planctomycetes bacterium]|nr:type II secretion system protein [Planctomycetota bacterium]